MHYITRCGPSRNPVPSILSVYSDSGQACLGHLLNRGKCGWESFDVNDKSLGTFPTTQAAAAALPEGAFLPRISGAVK
jgi:hypothetical protein